MQRSKMLSRVISIILITTMLGSMLPLSPIASAESEIIYVDALSCSPTSPVGDGSSAFPFCSISESILASSSGDTIEVASGTYNLTQSISIPHSITINGAKSTISALTRTAGDSSESTIDARASSGAFTITSSNVSISGFDILGDENTRFGFSISGNNINLSNIEIQNNIIHGMAKKLDQMRTTSWGILTEAKGPGFTTNTLDGLHIHGNHIYEIGGFNDSIGLGISLHEVVSEQIDGGALIENNRFSNIHDGLWLGVNTPGMGVVAQEEIAIYPTDYQSGITLKNNEYNDISVGAALQVSERGVFNEQGTDFQSVDVYLININFTTTVNENNLGPFAKITEKNITYNIDESSAYFASPTLAISETLARSLSVAHTITLSSGVFDEDLLISPTRQLSNLLITTTENGNPTFTGGIHLLGTYGLNNITIEGLTIQGEATPGIAFNIDSSAGISDLTIKNMTINGGGNTRSGIIASGLAGSIIVEDNNFNDLDGPYVYTTTPDGIDSSAGQISSLSFSNNVIADSLGSVQIIPAFSLISSGSVINNSFTNSGSNSVPMISISNAAVLTIDYNELHNLGTSVGISVQDARYLSVSSNNFSDLDYAITVSESNAGIIQSTTFNDNSFTDIGIYAIEVPIVLTTPVVVNQNWFGTTNITEIYGMVQGNTQIGEQWNSWPGEDTDDDGWANEFDLCPGYNDAIDIDVDGIPDGCDSLIDRDNDLISDGEDNCLTIMNYDQANYDNDTYGDLCDNDDDNDGMPDEEDGSPLDACPRGGEKYWTRTMVTDPDGDGCHNQREDDDDDNDGLVDANDACDGPGQTLNWISNGTTDYDADGCKDSNEDLDDDNDGIDDSTDSCPVGELNWNSSRENDFDTDGCNDSNEDLDDDNDGILDSEDICPKQYVNNVTDKDGDGCFDDTTTELSFTERFMNGDLLILGVVMISIIMIFVVGIIIYMRNINDELRNKMIVSVNGADTLRRLTTISNRVKTIYMEKTLTQVDYDKIQKLIEERRALFGEDAIIEFEKGNEDLALVFAKAVDLDLTNDEAVARMNENIECGRFEPEYYLKMWKKRIKASTDTSKPSSKEKVKTTDSKNPQAETMDSPPALTKNQLTKMKKAELIAFAKERDLLTSGTKPILIERILSDAAPPVDEKE